MPIFAIPKYNGALDEWLSQRSAKPSTAVRIRQAPLKKCPTDSCRAFFVSDWGYIGAIYDTEMILRKKKSGNPFETDFQTIAIKIS